MHGNFSLQIGGKNPVRPAFLILKISVLVELGEKKCGRGRALAQVPTISRYQSSKLVVHCSYFIWIMYLHNVTPVLAFVYVFHCF